MQTAPIPANESERLESLKKLNILDTPPEDRFDRIIRLATKIFNVPISTITLVDSNHEWYKSVCGLDEKEGDRAVSFCGHAMLEDEILIIPDAKKDPRFSDNPMVIGEPFVRFYAGVPLFSADGARIGTFCVKGHEPREITDEEKDILKGLAKWTELEINTHNLSVALDQVKKSTEEIDTFFETSQDIMAIANTNGYFEKVNPAMTKILGYTTEELTKNLFLSFVHPDDQKATLGEVGKLAKGALTINFVNRYRAKGGEYLWFQWNATPRGAQIYAIARNISEARELEIQSKIQAERMEQITDRFTFATKSARIGIWEWDVINNRLVWDNQMYALYGIKQEQFSGAYEAWQAGLHPDDKKPGDDAIQQALAGEKEFDTSFRVIWPDKSIHYIKAYGSVEKDEKGVPQRMVGVNWDITADRVSELKLKQFEAVIRDTDDAVFSKTLDGTVTNWNAGAQKLYGYTPEEIIGKSIRIIMPPGRDELDQLLAKIAKGERIPNYATLRKRKDGLLVDVSLTISPIYDDHNTIVGASVVARDITHEKQLDKMKDEFLSVASHELRTPLTAIDGLVSMILAGEYGQINETLKQPLSDVNKASERLINLVNDLLSVSRLQAGRLKFTLSDFDIKPVIEETVSLLTVVAKEKGLTLMAPNIENNKVQADIDKVKQILNNLIGNSLKFTDQGGITVSASIKDDLCTISIEDTGIGIKDEDKEKLFQKFQQLDSGTGRPAGTGLGLYIAKAMCLEMGGDLNLVSSKLNKGSIFTFSLPLAGSKKSQEVKSIITNSNT